MAAFASFILFINSAGFSLTIVPDYSGTYPALLPTQKIVNEGQVALTISRDKSK
jgi:hypothetical protein